MGRWRVLLKIYLGFVVGASAQIQVKPLVELDAEVSQPSLSPDGKTLAFEWCKADYSCGVYMRALAGGEVQLLVARDKKESLATEVRWSPVGKLIAFSRFYSHYDNHLVVRDAGGGAERDFGVVCDRATEASWSPDGRFLAASVYVNEAQSMDCRLVLFSAETGRRVRRLASSGYQSAFSPDGKMLAYADGNRLMLLPMSREYQPEGAARTLVRELREIGDVFWTPDGKQVIYWSSREVPYRRVELTAGAKPQPVEGIGDELSIRQFLPDGGALATESKRIDKLWRADLRTSPPKIESLGDSACSSGIPECSPDGRQKVFVRSPEGIAEMWISNADGTKGRPLVRPVPGFSNPKVDGGPMITGWSPDGKWIAFTVFPTVGNADGRTYLYVVPSAGGALRRLGKEAYSLSNPCWSRDSKSLYATQDWDFEDKKHQGRSPLVRVDVADGSITEVGVDGIWPKISPDGGYLYFFASRRHLLSRVPVTGGAPETLGGPKNLLWYSYAVGARDVYLFQSDPSDRSGRVHTLLRFDPASRQATVLAQIAFDPRFAQLSPDERYLYFTQHEDRKSRVVLVEGIR